MDYQVQSIIKASISTPSKDTVSQATSAVRSLSNHDPHTCQLSCLGHHGHNPALSSVSSSLIGANGRAIAGPVTLAYTFGLRHALDADHIAAIDNVSRKLVALGQTPGTVGTFFR